ncbi:galactokinase [Desulfosediminicola ganghwensis]|uniref:galactokinase n=1 Tax=Desulfosediminicola ganghwensis TaxID=2569540 RepID=UPI001C3D8664|nr:galactokinase family protein [Desulfosediminicola ganghwensis]
MIGRLDKLKSKVVSGDLDCDFISLYGREALGEQKQRYLRLLETMLSQRPEAQGLMVSAPGRTELGGNHTDHNHGNVLAAAVDLDCVAAVTPIKDSAIIIDSEGFTEEIRVDLGELQPVVGEEGSARSLVRGMAGMFRAEGGKVGGFHACLHATCRPGTGLSSSAAFSVLVGGILNLLYNDGSFSAEKIAIMAQSAENRYFGKPCGLMDQMSSGVGRITAIDFAMPQAPKIRRIRVPDDLFGYSLVVVDTGGSHVELTPEYAAIPEEMQAAARVLNQPVARGLSVLQVLAAMPEIRQKAGDRAALRLLHCVEENERAVAMAHALERSDFDKFLQLAADSGESSAMLLQNCASQKSTTEQGVLLGLALSKRFCPNGICRVHGGGFAGTIQAYIPARELADYRRRMEHVFGLNSVISVHIGRPGICGIGMDGLEQVWCECEEKNDA